MAKLHITEFQRLPKDAMGHIVPIPRMAPLTEQVVSYTTATQSNAFNTKTKFIRLIADAKAHLGFGGAPVADANNSFIPANVAEFFSVNSGEKVSVYDGSS